MTMEIRWQGHSWFSVTVGGKTIYHMEDTDFIPEMSSLGKVDVVFLPIGGRYTMDVSEAAEAVRRIRPGVTTPMHNLKTDPSVFTEKVEPEFKVVGQRAGATSTFE
jgi:L-ascorbate metabolism protein UlaG (beta-lactamase superfamily)